MRTAVLCAAVVLAACTPRVNTNPDTGRVDVDLEPVTQRGEVWNARIADRGGSGITGTSRVTVREDHTIATLSISGGRSGGVHPWHIHEGTCATGGPVVGPASAYPPLNVASNGQASAEAHLMLQLNEAQSYHINVHASPTEMGNIVACGALED
ncbi:MAG TPA: hypothetical protein VHG28_17690 [Longimicrobiaceae bacterium]|nr:hypothetical protein [Longimicrobiaceae bacterium]